MSKQKRGLFITFEGGEGVGKTTLIEGIYQRLTLKAYLPIKTREPGSTHLGETLRNLLLSKQEIDPMAELCLFLAARAEHLEEVILPAIQSGKIILCDRFNDSTIAYQGVARELGVTQVSQMCEIVCKGIEPDLTLYLDIDPEVGIQRIQKRKKQDRIEMKPLSFHQTVRKAYLSLQKKNPSRMQCIDASQSKERVLQEAMQLLSPLLERIEHV